MAALPNKLKRRGRGKNQRGKEDNKEEKEVMREGKK
jgi:hypothetical protein